MVMRLVLVLMVALVCAAPARAGKGLTAVPEPIAAPALDVADLSGRLHALEAYRGKPLVVSFWASWCAPCRVEMPSLARLHAARGEEIAVLAVNLGDTPEKIAAFLDVVDTGALTILTDPGSSLSAPWHIVGLPVTYVVAPDGTLSLVALGAREWDDPAIVERILSTGQ